MTTLHRHLLSTLALAAVLFTVTACSDRVPPKADESRATTSHPVRGKVIEIQADDTALLVAHEEIPGYMPAMTMRFKTDLPTLQRVSKGDVITGTLVQRDEEFWIENVQITAP